MEMEVSYPGPSQGCIKTPFHFLVRFSGNRIIEDKISVNASDKAFIQKNSF